MAFPTTSVLSSFPGSDEDPLSEGGNWAGPMSSGQRQLRLVSNEAARSNTGAAVQGQSYWTLAQFTDCEVFATVSVLPEATRGLAVWGRLHNPGNATTAEAYLAVYTTGTGFRLFRLLAGSTFTQLTVDATVMSAGDKLGLEVSGSVLRCLHFTGGAWVERGFAIDTNITGAGYIGAEIQLATARFDDFGGGERAAAQSFYVSRRRTVSR